MHRERGAAAGHCTPKQVHLAKEQLQSSPAANQLQQLCATTQPRQHARNAI